MKKFTIALDVDDVPAPCIELGCKELLNVYFLLDNSPYNYGHARCFVLMKRHHNRTCRKAGSPSSLLASMGRKQSKQSFRSARSRSSFERTRESR